MNKNVFGIDELLTRDQMKECSTILLDGKTEEKITGDCLYKEVVKVSKSLLKSGVGDNTKVIIQIQSKKLFIVFVLSLLKIGAVPIILPVNINKNSAIRLEKICSENSDAVLICDNVGGAFVQAFISELKNKKISAEELFNCKDSNREYELKNREYKKNADTALIIYSSGSTSDPKGIMMTHSGIIHILKETNILLNLDKQDILLSWLPIEHTFGLIYFLLLPIFIGCGQIHLETSRFAENPLSWLDAIHKYRASVTAAPNFAYQLVLKTISENDSWDLSCIRYILNGGEPISRNVIHDFLRENKRFNLKDNCIIPIYGMTETSGAVVFNFPYAEPVIDMECVKTGIDYELDSLKVLKNDLVCQGSAIRGCSIKIVDDFGNDLGKMKIGNIQLKGEFLCKGYFNKESLDLFTDGWLNTGDLGFISESGLFIVGRKKDMFFIHGKNVYMRDIEQLILNKYGVRSAACGENDATEEKSKIYLFIELDVNPNNYEDKKVEIIKYIQHETGIKLSDVIFRDSMFMTQVGKFSKNSLLKIYKGTVKK